jgi:hydrophobic/amphiphilic exporter-1 (mainly G- bacteria), HAE1 family
MPLLPPGMPSPPSFRKVNPADAPILFLTLSSQTLPMNLNPAVEARQRPI